MSDTTVLGLSSVATNSELVSYLNDPDVSNSFPQESDSIFFLKRFYSGDRLNWCRALDQLMVIRVVSRNSGTDGSDDSSDSSSSSSSSSDSGGETETAPTNLGLPSPSDLFNLVWKRVPDFVKEKIKTWAKANQGGAIAQEIAEYVKKALSALPVPVPAFFLNAAVNLVIPPLVTFIICKLTGDSSNGQQQSTQDSTHTYLSFVHTADTLKTMKAFDRGVLLAAGLSPSALPRYLKNDSNSTSDDTSTPVTLGQPDEKDARLDMLHFYQLERPNGNNSLQLTQIVAAQIRTNPDSDPPVNDFAVKVWGELDADTKKQIKTWAQQNPPDRNDIGTTLYPTVHDLLKKKPYLVPGPILDSFCAMKVPEVVEWVIETQGN